ncbi:ribonuclease HII [bacterium]|nr:ribonuclease HII [bacterium]
MTSDDPSLSLLNCSKKEGKNTPSFDYEMNLYKAGYENIAGVDEAGRGPLCGPVVGACVILEFERIPRGIDDSKKLKPSLREKLFEEIVVKAKGVGIGIVDERQIDRINILRSAILAMEKAHNNLDKPSDFILVDGNKRLPLDIPQLAVVKGDSKSLSIAAASIVAKVTRDRIMAKFHKIYPFYKLNENMGYSTPEHLEALEKYGPSRIHRRTFNPVKKFFNDNGKKLGEKILFGKKGEDKAVKFLVDKGYEIIDRNYRSPEGEIDVIAKKSGRLIFIEVKTRKKTSFGEPEESINELKKNKILNCAEHYLKANYNNDIPVDFEVIAIIEQKNTSIRHIKLFD